MEVSVLASLCSFVITVVGVGVVYGKLQANVKKNEEKNAEQSVLIDKCAAKEQLDLAVKRADEDRSENRRRIDNLFDKQNDQEKIIARIDTKLESIQNDFSSVLKNLEKLSEKIDRLGTPN